MSFKSAFQTTAILGAGVFLTACTDENGSFPPLDLAPKAKIEAPEITPKETLQPDTQVETAALVKPKDKPKEIAKIEKNLGTGQTAKELGKVSAEEEAKATAKPATKGKLLGETIGSLGLLDRSGIWISTPLVTTQTQGRVVVKKTGKSANITLIPLGGDAGAGSQVSLSAMQLLGIPITDLPVLDIYSL